jgi:hypothetical protein
MTLFSVATPATAMKYFTGAIAAMVWTIIFLFLALRFFFMPPVIGGIAIGLVALVYAMGALVGGTLRRVRQMQVSIDELRPGQDKASRMLTGSMLVGSLTIFAGIVGQALSTWFAIAFLSGLWDLWLGLMVFGLVIQLYGQAAYLKNLA